MLRSIFEPKMEEVTRTWNKQHNMELHNSLVRFSASVNKTIKSRARWEGQVAHVEEKRNSYKILIGTSK
jgi:hypothetical protein